MLVYRTTWASGVRRMNQLNGYGLTTGVCRAASCFNIIIALRRSALRDTVICLSVCPSPRRAAALGYKHAGGCLQLSRVRTADWSADGRRSAASRTAVGGRHIVSPPPLPPGRYLISVDFVACTWVVET